MNEADKTIDDPFGSDDEEFSLMHKEWSKVDTGLKNAGVRDGLEAGQDQILQNGFNSAFRNALKMAMSAGKLQGSISALLSYKPPSVKSEDSSYCTADSPKLPSETQLNELLVQNTDLLSQIPQMLIHSKLNTIAKIQPEISEPRQRDFGIASGSSTTVTPCSETTEVSAERHGEFSQTAQASSNCEEVCSNRAHFWSQLESFKIQACSLGVVTESDQLS